MEQDQKNAVKQSLKKGDVLLYFDRASLMDWAIAIKTFTCIAHIEIYTGTGMSVASRNGVGVNRYPLRMDGLVCVRRPAQYFDFEAAEKWFETVRGQDYDWKGLLCFTLAVKQGSKDKMYCSEFGLRWCRAGSYQPFNPALDADCTPPSYFWASKEFFTVWGK